MPKKLKGYRTILFNVLATAPVLVEIATQIAVDPTVHAIIPPKYMPHYIAAVTIGNIILRAVTNTPLGKGKPTDVVQEVATKTVISAISDAPVAKAAAKRVQKPRQPRNPGR